MASPLPREWFLGSGSKTRVVQVGPLVLTQQAAIVLALGTSMTVLATLLGVFVHPAFVFLAGLPTLALTLYSTYLVNCVVVGQCVALSWFLVAVLATYTLLSFASLAKIASGA